MHESIDYAHYAKIKSTYYSLTCNPLKSFCIQIVSHVMHRCQGRRQEFTEGVSSSRPAAKQPVRIFFGISDSAHFSDFEKRYI